MSCHIGHTSIVHETPENLVNDDSQEEAVNTRSLKMTSRQATAHREEPATPVTPSLLPKMLDHGHDGLLSIPHLLLDDERPPITEPSSMSTQIHRSPTNIARSRLVDHNFPQEFQRRQSNTGFNNRDPSVIVMPLVDRHRFSESYSETDARYSAHATQPQEKVEQTSEHGHVEKTPPLQLVRRHELSCVAKTVT